VPCTVFDFRSENGLKSYKNGIVNHYTTHVSKLKMVDPTIIIFLAIVMVGVSIWLYRVIKNGSDRLNSAEAKVRAATAAESTQVSM